MLRASRKMTWPAVAGVQERWTPAYVGGALVEALGERDAGP